MCQEAIDDIKFRQDNRINKINKKNQKCFEKNAPCLNLWKGKASESSEYTSFWRMHVKYFLFDKKLISLIFEIVKEIFANSFEDIVLFLNSQGCQIIIVLHFF